MAQLKDTDWSGVTRLYSRLKDGRADTVFPFLLQLIASDSPRRILDYGAGDGRFAIMCAESGFDHVTAYEPAEDLCEFAREASSSIPKVKVVPETSSLEEGSFDLAVMNAVWMSLISEDACIAALSDVNRLLRSKGTLVASVTHPCFRNNRFETLAADFELSQYWANGSKFEVTLGDGSPRLTIVDTHWNLTAMSCQLCRTGFVIREMAELPDKHGCGSPPAWLILRASKDAPSGKPTSNCL